ncbi:uncharacterized protein LOC117336634 [Pecten maximus]|uniref:uncharacterized protein LOC117336634 n=1 Tax=Pecten maximus TaxID=6579 RepID=UPI0014584A76|nr:uncharacterized protein LOC117336634 [Pecten maximus]
MKKAEWAKITQRINSVGLYVRTIEETKKRWQDALSSVKKKEAFRRRQMTGTGGGPPPDLTLKPWERIVLQAIPEVAVVGIESAADTGVKGRTSTVTSCILEESNSIMPCTSLQSGPVETQFSPEGDNGEEDEEETCVMYVNDRPAGESKTSQKGKKNRKREEAVVEDPTYEALLQLKRKRLAVEERKADALERIAVALESAIGQEQSLSSFSDCLSPIIKVSKIY